MKVGDLVQISPGLEWKYPEQEWCEKRRLKVVIAASETCIVLDGRPKTWMPHTNFVVVSKYENR